MFNEWYRTADGIKSYFEDAGEFQNLDYKLNDEGILFEYDCGGLITSGFIEHSSDALKELFNAEYLPSTVVTIYDGWNYFIFNIRILDLEEAQKLALDHFNKKFKTEEYTLENSNPLK